MIRVINIFLGICISFPLLSTGQVSDTVGTQFLSISLCDVPETHNLDSIKPLLRLPLQLQDTVEKGIVVFRILIDTTGSFESPRIMHTSHEMLIDSAKKYMLMLRFEMGECHKKYLKNNSIEKYWLNIPFRNPYLGRTHYLEYY